MRQSVTAWAALELDTLVDSFADNDLLRRALADRHSRLCNISAS